MRAAGIEHVGIMETGGHPVVYGDWLHAAGKPTILIYGHFDTQPVDPVDLWTQPPFDPVVRENRIYARGASDDKGNMLIPILSVESLLKTRGELPVNLKFFFEGQEEIGSPNLPDFIASHTELLACDMVLSADGGQWAEGQPSLTLGLRGLCALQIDVTGAARDVHSGTYGGTFRNPIHALARIIAALHDTDGRVAVDGFYDKVRALSAEERARLATVPFDETDYRSKLGIDELFGETGFSTIERAWIRPTLEINGIWGGFQGEGTKTVIPSKAHAKITCRLVPDQNPREIRGLVARFIRKIAPSGVTVTVREVASVAEPFVVPEDFQGNQAARRVHRELFGVEPYFVRMGGSIPVCGLFLKHLNAYTVNFAFGLKDENVHAPDEFFRLSSFETGQRAYVRILEELAAG